MVRVVRVVHWFTGSRGSLLRRFMKFTVSRGSQVRVVQWFVRFSGSCGSLVRMVHWFSGS